VILKTKREKKKHCHLKRKRQRNQTMMTYRIPMEMVDVQDRRVPPRHMMTEVDGRRRRIVPARIRRHRRLRIRQGQDPVGLGLDLGRDPGLHRSVANPAEIEDGAVVVNKRNVHATIHQLVMPVLGAAVLVAAGKQFSRDKHLIVKSHNQTKLLL